MNLLVKIGKFPRISSLCNLPTSDYLPCLEQIEIYAKPRNELRAAQDLDRDILHLSQKLKEKLLEKSVIGDTEIASFWDNITFGDLTR